MAATIYIKSVPIRLIPLILGTTSIFIVRVILTYFGWLLYVTKPVYIIIVMNNFYDLCIRIAAVQSVQPLSRDTETIYSSLNSTYIHAIACTRYI